MTYFFQLMSPFLLILGFSMIGKCSTRQWLILPLVLFSFYKAYDILPKDFSYDAESWQKIDRLIAESDEVLATQMLGMILMKNNKAVYQNGHTFYFPLATNKPDWLLKDREEDRVASVWNEYITGLYRKIERKEFDLVLVSSWEMLGIFSRNSPPFEDVSGKDFLSRDDAVDEKIKLSMTDRYGGGTYTILVSAPQGPGPRVIGQYESDFFFQRVHAGLAACAGVLLIFPDCLRLRFRQLGLDAGPGYNPGPDPAT